MKNILEVGFGKGEADFRISGGIGELSHEQMNEFRSMIVVAIGTAEEMWRYAQNKKHAVATAEELKQ